MTTTQADVEAAVFAAATTRRAPAAPAGAVEYAGWARRSLAWGLDAITLWIAASILFSTVLLAPLALLLFPVYFTVAHARRGGRTFGKAAVGIAVRDQRTFGPLGYRRAFGRWLVTALFWLPFGIASVVVLVVAFAAAYTGDESELGPALALCALNAVPGLLDGLSPCGTAATRRGTTVLQEPSLFGCREGT